MRMGSGILQGLWPRIEKLRAIDEVIDFSRSVIQLRLFICLGLSRNGVTVDALVDTLGERRKAITDAIRKMRLKGLVATNEHGVVTLTDRGKIYFSMLEDVLSVDNGRQRIRLCTDSSALNIETMARTLVVSKYLLAAVLKLGSSRNRQAPIRKLAKVMGLSQDRARSYLDMYVPVIFYKVRNRTFRLSSLRTRNETFYGLTFTGFKLYKRLCNYIRA